MSRHAIETKQSCLQRCPGPDSDKEKGVMNLQSKPRWPNSCWSRRRAALAACGLLMTGAAIHAQSTAPRVRTIPYTGRPIADRLQADDQIVTVAREVGGVEMAGKASLRNAIEYKVRMSDIVVTLDVSEAGGVLVEAGAWIDTRVAGTVREVLMARKPPLSVGERIEFHVFGGEIQIGTVLVKAWKRPNIVSRKRYLVFLETMPDTRIAYPTYGPFLIEKGRVQRQSRSQLGPGIQEPLNDQPVARIAAEVRRAMAIR